MIKDALQQLGFSDKEQQVYLAILKSGRITPARLAQQTNLNRTTAYSIAQSLQLKGVISEDATATTLTYVGASPDDLSNLIEGEKRALKKKEALVDEVISELDKADREQGVAAPKLTFVRESELERFLYKRSPIWDASLKQYDSIWWGFQTTSFVSAYQEWIKWYWQESRPAGISLQLITNNDSTEQEMAQERITARQMKFWEQTTVKETTWVVGDYLVLIATEQHPHYLVEIKNPLLCNTLREMFKQIWNQDAQKSK